MAEYDLIIKDGQGNNIQNGGNLPMTTNPPSNKLNNGVYNKNNAQYVLSD